VSVDTEESNKNLGSGDIDTNRVPPEYTSSARGRTDGPHLYLQARRGINTWSLYCGLVPCGMLWTN